MAAFAGALALLTDSRARVGDRLQRELLRGIRPQALFRALMIAELRDFREQAGIFCRNRPDADAFAGASTDEFASAGVPDDDLEMLGLVCDFFTFS